MKNTWMRFRRWLIRRLNCVDQADFDLACSTILLSANRHDHEAQLRQRLFK